LAREKACVKPLTDFLAGWSNAQFFPSREVIDDEIKIVWVAGIKKIRASGGK
jgi:hypothetical protein